MARRLAVATGVVVIAAAAGLAAYHNQSPEHPGETAAPERPGADPERIAEGRELFDRFGCLSCHSIGGRGNPRSALDGIGARMTPDEIARRITAPRHGTQSLSQEDLGLLVAYLANSK